GIVGYQMLAGETPFKAVNTPAMLLKHISERPRPIRERCPDTPSYLAVSIDRALAKRPEDRWATATELKDALTGAERVVADSRRNPPPPLPSLAPMSPIAPVN